MPGHYAPILVSGDAAAQDAFSDTHFNYAATFAYMARRRLQRQFQGVYAGPSQARSLVSHTALWVYVGTAAALGSNSCEDRKGISAVNLWPLVGAFAVLMLLTDGLRSRLLTVMGLCGAAVHAWYFAATGDIVLFSLSNRSPLQRGTLVALVLAEAVIVVVYLSIYHVYPTVISRVDTPQWFNVRRGRRANTITYRALTVHKLWRPRRRFTIQYTGGLDREFRPHGFGIWKDTSYHGEALSGAWEHGIPIGPFASREHGSGYASRQIRIAYASYRGETSPTATYISPKFPADRKLIWGVARVESPVAGDFFEFLPSVGYFFHRENAPESAQECVATLRTPLDDVCSTDSATRSTGSSRSVCSSSFHESLMPASISRADTSDGPEALIFIHGMDYSLENAIKLYGQLLALGDFPSHIHPFLFSWASGKSPFVSYWAAKPIAETEEIATALYRFVSSIVDAGYSRVHFVSHSIGSRMFLNAVERGAFSRLLLTETSMQASSIASVTMCSPEYPLSRFVAARGGYDALREFCPLITIYGDKWDWALRVSELANPHPSKWGRFVQSLGRSVDSIVRDETFTSRADCVRESLDSIDDTTASTIAAVNQAAGYPGVTMFSQCDFRVKTPGSAPHSYGSVPDYDDDATGSDEAKPRVYLDVDVVNTSFTDTNVGSRHSYFRVNESIAADIRELVVHKRRAKRRAGLMRQQGNMFVFLAAPKDIL